MLCHENGCTAVVYNLHLYVLAAGLGLVVCCMGCSAWAVTLFLNKQHHLGPCGCNLIMFVTCIKVDDWLVSRDLKMKPKLGALQAMFPDISMPVLQEQLAAADGHLPNAVKV